MLQIEKFKTNFEVDGNNNKIMIYQDMLIGSAFLFHLY